MLQTWLIVGVFEATEQRLADQARAIKTNQWLSEFELEEIKSRCNDMESEREREIERDSSLRESDNQQSESQNERRGIEISAEIDEESREILQDVMAKYNGTEELMPMNLRNVNRNSLKEKVKKVNSALRYVHTDDITETNRLILAAAVVVQEELGVKRKEKRQKGLWWKKRLCDQVASLRKDLSRVDRIEQGKLKNHQQATRLEKKYNISKKGIMVVKEELKQRIIAVSAKIKRYNERHNQFVQNRLFQSNQKRLYEKIDGVVRYNEGLPEAEECREFWRGIWEKEVDHNRDVKWLDDLKKELNGVERQSELTINTEILVRQLRKIPN